MFECRGGEVLLLPCVFVRPWSGVCKELSFGDALPSRELNFVYVFLGILVSTSLSSSVALSFTSSRPGSGESKEL